MRFLITIFTLLITIETAYSKTMPSLKKTVAYIVSNGNLYSGGDYGYGRQKHFFKNLPKSEMFSVTTHRIPLKKERPTYIFSYNVVLSDLDENVILKKNGHKGCYFVRAYTNKKQDLIRLTYSKSRSTKRVNVIEYVFCNLGKAKKFKNALTHAIKEAKKQVSDLDSVF